MHPDEPSRRSAVAPGRGRAVAIVALVAFVLNASTIVMPPDWAFIAGAQTHGEELIRGSAARDLLRGPLLAVQDYQLNDFWGGALLMTLLAVPAFALLGPTLVALRSTTLVFSTLLPVAGFLLLDRWVGRRAAWCGGLLLALPPPGYVFNGMFALGAHMEHTPLALLLVVLVLAHHERGKRAGVSALAVGVLAGACLSYGYAILPFFALLFVYELYRDRWFFARRDFAVRAAGFAIGALHWLTYHAQRGFESLQIYGQPLHETLAPGGTGSSLDKARRLFVDDLPRSLAFGEAPVADGPALGRAVVAVLLALAGFALWRRRRELAAALRPPYVDRPFERSHAVLAIAAMALVQASAYVVSGFTIGEGTWIVHFRYLMPLLAFLLLLAGIGCADLIEARPRFGRVATVALVALFAVGTLRQLHPERFGSTVALAGYEDRAFARFVVMRHGADERRMGRALERLLERPREERDAFSAELARVYAAVARFPSTGAERQGPGITPARAVEMLDHLARNAPAEVREPFRRTRAELVVPGR